MEDDELFAKAANKSKPTKKRNIFDDDLSEDAVRSIIKSSPFDDDDDTVGLSEGDFGFQQVKFENKSKPHPPAPDLSSLATPASRTRPAPENSQTMSSSASFGGASRAMGFGHTRSQSLTFGAAAAVQDKGLQRPKFVDSSPFSSSSSLQDTNEAIDKSLQKLKVADGDQFSSSNSLQSISEAKPVSSGPRENLSAMDIDKMQQEIQSLKRSLISAKRERWVKLPVEDTLRKIMKGEAYSLEMYRSLSDKLDLLDQATRLHDGNAITAAVLFFHKTVSRHIFTRELVQRPVAADHYLMYLKAHFDFPEYISILKMLGRTEEAAICKYQNALPTSDANVKISKLNDTLRSHFQADPALASDTSLVQEHVDLLERQRPIDESDANLEASGRSALFKDFPRKRSLIDMSVVTTLYYCCLYHYDLGENSLASPAALRKRHQISDKQFTWTAVGARAKLRQWKDIETVLTTKGWFGSTKLKAPIGFDKVVTILHRNNAPQDILQKYLGMVDNLEMRLNLAKKVSCPLAVIDALVALKNRPELEQYAAKLDRYSKEGLYAFDVLNTSTIKWK